RPNCFRCVPTIGSKVLGSAKRSRQELALPWGTHLLIVEGLRVKHAIEVVTCMRVPTMIAPGHKDKKSALGGSPDPQHYPQFVVFPNCDGGPVLARNHSQLHEAYFWSGGSDLSGFVERASPESSLVRSGSR